MAARPATKVRKSRAEPTTPPPKEPSEEALRLAETLSNNLQQRSAKVRFDFVRNPHGVPGPPPLAQLLRGGRGGDVRLKLLLSLLWVAGGGTDDRHKTKAYPARAWAGLLDLPEPDTNGQRRIRDAIQWLEDRDFIRSERQPGRPMAIQLLLEDGSGKTYFDPAEHAHRKKKSKGGVEASDLFITLPHTFWTDGWIVTLSGRATAMLLVLASVTLSDTNDFKWIAPSRARQRYGLSEDTWSRGAAELKARGLIEVRKQAVGEDAFDFRRVRNSFKVPRDDKGWIVLPPPEARARQSRTHR
jgi:hypothetical protein